MGTTVKLFEYARRNASRKIAMAISNVWDANTLFHRDAIAVRHIIPEKQNPGYDIEWRQNAGSLGAHLGGTPQ
jgi:hypothetical protein